MIRVGMGYECPWLCIQWIQPQVELRQIQPSLKTHFNQSAASLSNFCPSRKGNRSQEPELHGRTSVQ